jgi:hypothetical protein
VDEALTTVTEPWSAPVAEELLYTGDEALEELELDTEDGPVLTTPENVPETPPAPAPVEGPVTMILKEQFQV